MPEAEEKPATGSPFTHLHVHSEYSLLDGLSGAETLIARAGALGMGALALTDHGVMYGAIDFYQAALAARIKPIVGCEIYVACRGMADRTSDDKENYHLVVLARNEEGYRNLLELTTRAHLDGFFYKPRVDKDLLARHRKGLVALSSCPSGEVPRLILGEDLAGAREAAATYRDIFGPDNFYLEVQNHGLEEETRIIKEMVPMSREMGIPLVATNDVHYAMRSHAAAHDLLLCIQTNSTLQDPKRMRMQPNEFYLKSPEEMEQAFAEIPEALANTGVIAERCNLKLAFGRLHLPALSHVVPPGETADSLLASLCRQQLPERYSPVTPEVRERLEYELGVIQKTGFASYMLFVWDFVEFARKRGILCRPRGSAAGSIVLYCLGVTSIDPIAYGLTFERFLNPERIQPPDIDMDFADDRRDEVIKYVVERYGRDHVAQIVTFGRLLAKAAIRDVGRALGLPLSEIDRVAKLVPSVPLGITLQEALEANGELQVLYDSQEQVRWLVDSARSVERAARHASTHAAGVVVSGDPLVKHVPLQRAAKGDDVVMTQYHMKNLERLGLLKIDFLGLTNLTILERAVRILAETRAVELDLDRLPLDDEKTYRMLSQGETTGIFQLEGAGMRRYIKELKPTNLGHIAAMISLYRPGPMAHVPTFIAAKEGLIPITYQHPSLEPILAETYGVIVYQDQVLQIVRAIAGFTLGQADVLRWAMGKKKPEEMKKERKNFMAGARSRGISEGVATRIWQFIEPFAGYAFNKAHAHCYALVAYQTAYLKANYPVEYMAAVLSTQATDTDKAVSAIGECRRLGIPVLPPDVNRSQVGFSTEPSSNSSLAGLTSRPGAGHPGRTNGTGVRYGLMAIKNVGEGAARAIVEERERRGVYRNLEEFCQRLDLRTINKRVIESLIKAGAMDSLGSRVELLAALDNAMAVGQHMQRAAEHGQASIFDLLTEAKPTPVSRAVNGPAGGDRRQDLLWEKEALGCYLSEHPFQEAARALAKRVTAPTSELSQEFAGQKVTVAGVVSGLRKLTTRSNQPMAAAQLEDLHGRVDIVAFPKVHAQTKQCWREGAILVVEGKLEVRGERVQVVCSHAWEWSPDSVAEPARLPLGDQAVAGAGEAARNGVVGGGEVGAGQAPAEAPGPRRLRITVVSKGDDRADMEVFSRLRDLLHSRKGPDSYDLRVVSGKRRVRLAVPEANVAFSPELEVELRELLGPGCLLVE